MIETLGLYVLAGLGEVARYMRRSAPSVSGAGVFATSKSPSLSFSFVVILSLLDCCLDGVVLISNDGFKLCLCCSPFPDGGVSSARTILLGEKLVLLFLVGESFNSSLSPLAIFFNGDDDKKVAAAVLTRVGDFPLGE